MTTRSHTGFFAHLFDKSLTMQVAYQTRVPLMSVPANRSSEQVK
jgi:hypothetical protein